MQSPVVVPHLPWLSKTSPQPPVLFCFGLFWSTHKTDAFCLFFASTSGAPWEPAAGGSLGDTANNLPTGPCFAHLGPRGGGGRGKNPAGSRPSNIEQTSALRRADITTCCQHILPSTKAFDELLERRRDASLLDPEIEGVERRHGAAGRGQWQLPEHQVQLLRQGFPGWDASAAAAGVRERDQEGGQEKGKAGTGRKGEARGSKGRQGKAKEGIWEAFGKHLGDLGSPGPPWVT